jgi:hypothetical protein
VATPADRRLNREPDQAAYGGHKADCGPAPMLLGNQKHVEIRPKRATPNVGKQKINGVERERVEAPLLGSITKASRSRAASVEGCQIDKAPR